MAHQHNSPSVPKYNSLLTFYGLNYASSTTNFYHNILLHALEVLLRILISWYDDFDVASASDIC